MLYTKSSLLHKLSLSSRLCATAKTILSHWDINVKHYFHFYLNKCNSSSTSNPTVSPESAVTQTPAADTTTSPGTTGTASTQAPSSTSETVSTKSPDSTSDAASTKTPDSSSDAVSTSSPVTATPTASPSETTKPTTSPTAVPISTPNHSYYTGDDSLSDYVTPTRTVYDTFHYLHCGYCLQKSSINHQRNRNIKHYLYKRWQWCIGLWWWFRLCMWDFRRQLKRWGTKWHRLFI